MRKSTYTIVVSDKEYEKACKGEQDFAEYFEGQIVRMLRHRIDVGANPTIECSLIGNMKTENPDRKIRVVLGASLQ